MILDYAYQILTQYFGVAFGLFFIILITVGFILMIKAPFWAKMPAIYLILVCLSKLGLIPSWSFLPIAIVAGISLARVIYKLSA